MEARMDTRLTTYRTDEEIEREYEYRMLLLEDMLSDCEPERRRIEGYMTRQMRYNGLRYRDFI
jgi:hypothetical protein